jgi:hypothetical protein
MSQTAPRYAPTVYICWTRCLHSLCHLRGSRGSQARVANKGAPPHVPPIRGGVDHYEVAGVAKRAVRRHDVRRCAYRVVGRRPHGPAQRVEVGGEVAVRLSLVSVSSAFVGVGPEPSARRRFSDGFPGLSVALLVELHVGRKPSGKVGRRSAAGSSEEAVSSLHKGRSA